VFSMVIGFLTRIFPYLVSMLNLALVISEVYWLNTVTRFVISPFLLFASFYLVGRNINLKTEFPSILVPLFFGSWIGHLISILSLGLRL
jgi:hypothetical protein